MVLIWVNIMYFIICSPGHIGDIVRAEPVNGSCQQKVLAEYFNNNNNNMVTLPF